MQKNKLSARAADRHVLYQESVQAPDVDARFLARYFKRYTGQPLRTFREDFCGTAILSCEFVKLHRENRALGVDLDGPTLEWARSNNLSALAPAQRERIQLIRDDVRRVRRPRVQLLAALNFSYSVFKTRQDMGAYIENTYRSLEPGGLLVLDAWGGGQVQFRMKERKKLNGFTYIWDQADFDPITHHIICKIHFEFRDGTRTKNAFVYDWRLWTLPELRELMAVAGFEDVHVLWEGTDRKSGEGNGVFRRVERGGDEEAWIAYVIGRKP
ncbi:MAG TPA: class I SAM-dependent methyltransferase [Vicinamibacteria bacterium]|nr:class I SAM-dependent methyltransferase [Vicinamibacteria bacterium]